MARWMMTTTELALLSIMLLPACGSEDSPPNIEGDQPGECTDDADNDRDGLFDCRDPDCAGSAACSEATEPGDGVKDPSSTGEGRPATSAQPPAAERAATPSESAGLGGNSIILMGPPGSQVEVFESMEVGFEGGAPQVMTGRVVALRPPGTTGKFVGPVYAMLSTFGAEVELADGTLGYVREGEYGLAHQVTGVLAGDVLNARSRPTHRSEKVAAIAPNGLVFVQEPAGEQGCEDMKDEDRWWRVRTVEGAEGYVNCHYVAGYSGHSSPAEAASVVAPALNVPTYPEPLGPVPLPPSERPSLLKMTLRARRTEARTNLDAIRTAEKAYHAEWDMFWPVPACPPGRPGPEVRPFDHQCLARWADFGWTPDGDVRCTYWVAVMNAASAADDDFRLRAICDIDGDGEPTIYEATRARKSWMVSPEDVF
jgi:hypothetical protein